MARKYNRIKPKKEYPPCSVCGKYLDRINITGKCKNCFRGDNGWLKNLSESHKGYRMPEEQKRKIRISCKGGNKTSWKKSNSDCRDLRLSIKAIFEYRLWRSDVFTRDNYTCQICNNRGGKLVVHHIKHFKYIFRDYNLKTIEDAINCEELWNINNGQTLCQKCHINLHKKDVDKYLNNKTKSNH